jgi:hypothetical protein
MAESGEYGVCAECGNPADHMVEVRDEQTPLCEEHAALLRPCEGHECPHLGDRWLEARQQDGTLFGRLWVCESCEQTIRSAKSLTIQGQPVIQDEDGHLIKLPPSIGQG